MVLIFKILLNKKYRGMEEYSEHLEDPKGSKVLILYFGPP